MTFDEAMRAAKRGCKVAPIGRPFFVYYHDSAGYRRVTLGGSARNEDYVPDPWDKLKVWDIYEKNSPVMNFFKAIKRAIGRTHNLTPALR